MAKFKINKNKQDLPEDLINRHKDFSKLMDKHQKITNYKDATKPLYKNPGFMSFIIVLCVVLLTFIITEKETEENTIGKDSTSIGKKGVKIISEDPQEMIYTDSTATIQHLNRSKVLETGADYQMPEVAYSSYKIDPAKGAVIYHKSTRILIPPFAFKDAAGSSIQNEVLIRYRELKDPVDTYMAGVPMHASFADQAFNLESAGMFEIQGYSGQQAVYIKEPITVEMAGSDHGNTYHIYFLNKKTNHWEYAGKENKFMRFMIQADEKQYPELKPFKNLIWEFAVNDLQKDPSQFRHVFSKTWSSFYVDEASVLKEEKNVKLKQNSSEPKFLAHPIPLLNDQEANKRLMKAKFDEYYSLLKTKTKMERDLTESHRRQQEWLNSPQGKAYLSWAKSDQGQRQILSSRVVTIFSIEKFGTWNCDQPVNLPKAAKLVPSFTDQFGKKLDLETIRLVDYSINTSFDYSKGSSIQFNPKSTNVMWAALPEGKLAVFSKEKFKAIGKTNGDYTFKMEVVDVNGKDANALRALLGMKEHVTAKAEIKDKDPVATYERVIQLKKAVRENDVFYLKDSASITSDIWRKKIKADEAELLNKEIKDNPKIE